MTRRGHVASSDQAENRHSILYFIFVRTNRHSDNEVNESGAFLKLFLVGGGTVAQTCAFGWARRISAREYWGMLDKIPLLIDLDYQCASFCALA
jgi:hypothetical protein